MNEKNVPKIRFQDFNESWKKCKLGDVIDYIVDNRGKNPKYYCKSGIPVIDNYMIKNTLYPNLTDANRFIDDYLFNNFIRKYNEADDILITLVGNGIGNISLFPREKAVIIQNTLGLRTSENKIFLFFLLMKKNKDIVALDRGMAQPSIRQDELLDIEISIPTYKEQEKIGNFFKKLDNLISLHQQKLEHLKKQKKGLLQKMFPKKGAKVPEIRFPEFTGDWEQRKFGDIAKRVSNTTMSSSDFPSVEYEDVISEQGTLNKDIYGKEIRKKGIVFNKEDVLYGKLRPYLKNWLNPNFSGVAVGDWWVLKPIKTDKNYLYRLIQTQQFDDIANQSVGTKMPRADWNLVANTIFKLPISLNEQAKIGDFFEKLDNLISLHQRKLEHLQKQKKALLQQMFI